MTTNIDNFDTFDIEGKAQLTVGDLSYGDDTVSYGERQTTVLLKFTKPYGAGRFTHLRINLPRGGGYSTVEVYMIPTGWVKVWQMAPHEVKDFVADNDNGTDYVVAQTLATVACEILN